MRTTAPSSASTARTRSSFPTTSAGSSARIDRFDYVDDVVFSPRTTFMIKPTEQHALRLSPTAPIARRRSSTTSSTSPWSSRSTSAFSPARRPDPLIQSVGNPDLTEEKLDAYEIGYTGFVAGRATLSAAFYVNKVKNSIFFSEVTSARYTATNPPRLAGRPPR